MYWIIRKLPLPSSMIIANRQAKFDQVLKVESLPLAKQKSIALVSYKSPKYNQGSQAKTEVWARVPISRDL